MEQTYFVLKEYFKNHDYPFDLIHDIIIFYNQICNIEMYFGLKILLKTQLGDIYYWTSQKRLKIQLPPIKKIVHHGNFTYVITQKGDLYAWGINDLGQLGLDNSSFIEDSPKKVLLNHVEDIIYGFNNALALTHNGDIYTWVISVNTVKIIPIPPTQFPLSNVQKIYCGDYIKFAITKTNELYTWEFDQPTKIMEGVKEVLHLSFIITLMDELYAVGCNKYGQLGLGHTEEVVKPQKVPILNVRKIVRQSYLTLAITLANEVYYWGYSDLSPVKLELPSIKDIVCGVDHITALTYDGQIYGWGNINYTRYTTPILLNLSDVREVISEYHHSFAITNKNELYAWGLNKDGQLGICDDEIVYTPHKVQIENVKEICCPFDYLTVIITWSGEVYYLGIWLGVKSNTPKKIFPF